MWVSPPTTNPSNATTSRGTSQRPSRKDRAWASKKSSKNRRRSGDQVPAMSSHPKATRTGAAATPQVIARRRRPSVAGGTSPAGAVAGPPTNGADAVAVALITSSGVGWGPGRQRRTDCGPVATAEQPVPQAPPGHEFGGLADDVLGHLGDTPHPVVEGDRHLDDLGTEPVSPVRQLHLEAVARGLGRVRLHDAQHVRPVGPEPGRGVPHG